MTQTAPWVKYIQAQRAMDPSVYLDAEVFEAERSKVLATTWQYAGHVSQLTEPGDFFTHEIAGESLFTSIK